MTTIIHDQDNKMRDAMSSLIVKCHWLSCVLWLVASLFLTLWLGIKAAWVSYSYFGHFLQWILVTCFVFL